MAQAITLFRDCRISASMAARQAGLSLPEMLTQLSQRGIPVTGTDDPVEEELLQEMRQASAWVQQAPTR